MIIQEIWSKQKVIMHKLVGAQKKIQDILPCSCDMTIETHHQGSVGRWWEDGACISRTGSARISQLNESDSLAVKLGHLLKGSVNSYCVFL